MENYLVIPLPFVAVNLFSKPGRWLKCSEGFLVSHNAKTLVGNRLEVWLQCIEESMASSK